MKQEIILQAKGIRKSFYHPIKTELLAEVDLTVRKGETVAIMGRSGEGKSTLLNILGTLDSPCSGTLVIDTHDVSRFNKSALRNRYIGFVFQSFHLLEDYTALENVLMPARIARKSLKKGGEAFERGMHLLEHVGLGHRAFHNTKLLSGGEKQRVGIARALCNNPDLILADEPSGNLDRENANQIHDLLLSFARDNDKALIVVTHDKELSSLCDTPYQLRDKQLVPA